MFSYGLWWVVLGGASDLQELFLRHLAEGAWGHVRLFLSNCENPPSHKRRQRRRPDPHYRQIRPRTQYEPAFSAPLKQP